MTSRAKNVTAGCTPGAASAPELTVAAGLARRLMIFAVSQGARQDELAEKSGIDPRELEDQDDRVPLSRYAALMRAGAELTGNPALALHFGEAVDMQEYSVVGLLFHASRTIMEGLDQVQRYANLVTEVDAGIGDRFQWQRARGGKLWVADMRLRPNAFPELTESTFARFMAMTRPLAGRSLVREVHVTHPAPPYRAEYDRIFGVPAVFGAEWNALRIDEAGLASPISDRSGYVFGVLGEHAKALHRQLERSQTMRERVQALLIPGLHTGAANVGAIARSLGMSRQTLFRRLKAEGVTFERVLDELRRELALHYLEGRNVSVSETAYLVGFSDPATFSRAFKRWTGSSPRSARRSKETRGD